MKFSTTEVSWDDEVSWFDEVSWDEKCGLRWRPSALRNVPMLAAGGDAFVKKR